MKLISMRKLGLAGGLAIAGLLLAPLAATADVNKCSKELAKNGAKIATDVQKELAKCVDGWLKEEDKAAANVVKGKDAAGGAYAGLLKGAEKCQKSIAKIGMIGVDIAVIDGATEKSKIGKSYHKLIDAMGVGTAGKHKCGPKTYDQAATDAELFQLGWLPTANVGDIPARQMAAIGVGGGWNVQNSLIADTVRTFAAMGHDRCSLSGLECDSTADCVSPHPKGTDVCQATNCPDCLKFARTANSSVGAPGLNCTDDAPSNPGAACADETGCGGIVGVTDFCDDTPPQGAIVGPCSASGCDSDNSGTQIQQEGVFPLGVPAVLNYFCDEVAQGNGHNPGGIQCDPADPQHTASTTAAPVALPVTLAGMNPNNSCIIEEVLPNAAVTWGGTARGITASVLGIPVCIDGARSSGYIDLGTTLPQFDVLSCGDVDINGDQSGAGFADACRNGTPASVNCTDTPILDSSGVLVTTSTSCLDLVAPSGLAVGGHSMNLNTQRLTVGTATADPCDPNVTVAVGEPSPSLLTTNATIGNVWDVGPLLTGGVLTDAGDFHFTNSGSGQPWSPTSTFASGNSTATLVGSFAIVATDPNGNIGHGLVLNQVSCQ